MAAIYLGKGKPIILKTPTNFCSGRVSRKELQQQIVAKEKKTNDNEYLKIKKGFY